jgi:glutathionylspermidine synthase
MSKYWVSKPLFGREGLGVMVSKNFTSFSEFASKTDENFGRDSKTNEKLGTSIY